MARVTAGRIKRGSYSGSAQGQEAMAGSARGMREPRKRVWMTVPRGVLRTAANTGPGTVLSAFTSALPSVVAPSHMGLFKF